MGKRRDGMYLNIYFFIKINLCPIWVVAERVVVLVERVVEHYSKSYVYDDGRQQIKMKESNRIISTIHFQCYKRNYNEFYHGEFLKNFPDVHFHFIENDLGVYIIDSARGKLRYNRALIFPSITALSEPAVY